MDYFFRFLPNGYQNFGKAKFETKPIRLFNPTKKSFKHFGRTNLQTKREATNVVYWGRKPKRELERLK